MAIRRKVIRWLLGINILFMGACVQYGTPVMPVVPIPDATYVGSEGCAVCHEDVFEYFRKTVHYRLRRFEVEGEDRGCESCHGPGSVHVEERGSVESIISFSQLTPAQRSEVCLKCHTRGRLIEWRYDLHAMSDVGCDECHKSHKTAAKNMLVKNDPDLCYDCHQQMQAKAQFPSHHPVREGKMKCNGCHNTHGAQPYALTDLNVNQLCYKCHTDKQGPYVYEHQPVEEDCSLCHDPHGAIANNLLKQSEPFLCLRCHRGHRGVQLAGLHPSMNSLMTSCTQCHSQIHGSDSPSQLGGGGLTR